MRRSPRLVLVSLLALGALLLSSAAAQAMPNFGVSQSYRDFGFRAESGYNANADVSRSIFWSPLQIQRLRVVVPWDLAGRAPSDGRRQEFEHWLNRIAQLEVQQGISIEPFVVFGTTERSPSTDNVGSPPRWSNVQTRCCAASGVDGDLVAPNGTAYREAVKAFLNTWGPGTPADVRVIGAWNEPNENEVFQSIPGGIQGRVFLAGGNALMNEVQPQCVSGPTPTNCGPMAAAWFWVYAATAMNERCTGCTVVAGEFNSNLNVLGNEYWNTYAAKLESITSLRPAAISFHGHHDVRYYGRHGASDCRVNNASDCLTYQFRVWLNARGGPWASMRVWDTEVGSQYDPGNSGKTADAAQRDRFNELVSLYGKYGVDRFYYYNFQQRDGSNDRGFIDSFAGLGTVNTRQRPIWETIRCRNGCGPWVPPPIGGNADSDVNGDGLSDLVTLFSPGTALTYPGQPGFQFGDGVQSFAGTMDPALFDGTGHHTIDVADVNGDLRADLVTLFQSGTVCVYPGQSNGAFSDCVGSFSGTMVPGLLKPAGHEPIAVSDVNGDGRGDLTTFFAPTGVVVTYLGQSNGTFADGVQSFAGTMDSARFDGKGHHFIDVSDVTGDGRADLTTMFTLTKTVVVYPGQANGSFGEGVQSFGGTYSDGLGTLAGHEPIDVADVTGDGHSDFVSFYRPTGEVVVYPGQPNGSFGIGMHSFAGTMDSSLFDGEGHELAAALDVNGDGRADLVSSYSDGSVYVYPGHPNGAFAGPAATFAGTFDSSRFDRVGHEIVVEKPSIRRLGCASIGCHRSRFDFSGDSKFDLFGRKPDGSIWMLRGNGKGGWKTGTPEWIGSGAQIFDRIMAPGDFDGDRKPDLLGRKPDGTLWMVRGNGNGGWLSVNPQWIGEGFNVFNVITTADFDGDEKADVIGRRPDGTLWLYRGNGAGGWENDGNGLWLGNDWNQFAAFIAGDFSGDGNVDVLAWRPDGTLWMYRGNGAGGWATGNGELIGTDWNQFTWIVSVPDFNGNGTMDLLTRKADGTLWLYRGNGAGGWENNGNGVQIGEGANAFDQLRGF